MASIASAAFSHDGRYVITGSWDNSAKIWNVKTGLAEWKLAGKHTRAIRSAVFSPVDANVALPASDDGTAKLWVRSDDSNGWRDETTFKSHKAGVRWAAFSPMSLDTSCSLKAGIAQRA